MDIINFNDVSVSSKRFTNNHQLFILFSNFANQIGSFSFHAIQEFVEKHTLIINPSGLISNLPNLNLCIITNDKSVFYSSLILKLMKRIFCIIADLIHNEYFFGEDFFVVLEVVNDHNGNFILRSSYIEGENFFPVWIHVQRSHDLICMFYLFIIIHNNLNHWLKLIRIEEIRVKLPINDVKIKSGPFHDFNSIDKESGFSFFQQI